ncbi:plasmid replication initiator TrfA [Paraburkholderia sp.]|uniref:plasmid replication initiator TrfA n=1 Tax=Paraburkholderia sp. TaxID=1926495 RepID=UPI0025EA1728|nr:plasmid replication initiator TrfA [Paraburkholderia sp.]
MTWPALSLPYGHGTNYPLPFAFVRTAVFSSMRYRGRERPTYAQKTEIARHGGVPVYQLAGEQLDGNDLDVMAGCIRLVYDTGALDHATTSVQFLEKEFLRQLGWKTGGAQRSALIQSLERMRTAVFEFQADDLKDDNGVCQQTALILDFTRCLDGNRMRYTVTLGGHIASLMRVGKSLVNRSQRNALRDNSLAQSLHAFYETHKQPIPLPEATLRPLMRRDHMRDDKWLKTLSVALTELQKQTGWECALSSKGTVIVEKPKRPVNPAARQSPALPTPVLSQDDDDI